MKMKKFNTSGPNIPKQHYTIERNEQLKQGIKLVEKDRYFTIWAPRQTGKSTYFRQLAVELEKIDYKVAHINFENYKNLPLSSFLKRFHIELKKQWKGVIKNIAKDGTTYIVNTLIIPLVDTNNEIIEYVGIRHDITELELYKDDLQHQLSLAVQEIEDTQKEVIINVIDNAGGIKLKDISKVFEPYYTSKFESNGVGIGLYMAKMLVEESLQGSLVAQNSESGAIFSIKI